jgi:hypothetical protein
MQMSSRVRRSWDELGRRFAATVPQNVAVTFAEWIASSLVQIAAPAAQAIADARSIQRLLQTPVDQLPSSQRAIDEATGLARREAPSDPLKAVELVDRIACGLTVYRLPSDCCPTCQGDLDVWTSLDENNLLVCNVLGCIWSLTLERTTRQLGRSPASRHNVQVLYPEADLVSQRTRP